MVTSIPSGIIIDSSGHLPNDKIVSQIEGLHLVETSGTVAFVDDQRIVCLSSVDATRAVRDAKKA